MAIWEKLFNKITFKNYPDTSTPLNADNLNKMSDAIDGIDDRVVELNSNLGQTNSNLGGLKFHSQKVSKTRISDQYPSVIQVYVANAKNKSIFITPGTGNTAYLPHILNIDKYENAINIVFTESLVANTTYYLDLLIIG